MQQIAYITSFHRFREEVAVKLKAVADTLAQGTGHYNERRDRIVPFTNLTLIVALAGVAKGHPEEAVDLLSTLEEGYGQLSALQDEMVKIVAHYGLNTAAIDIAGPTLPWVYAPANTRPEVEIDPRPRKGSPNSCEACIQYADIIDNWARDADPFSIVFKDFSERITQPDTHRLAFALQIGCQASAAAARYAASFLRFESKKSAAFYQEMIGACSHFKHAVIHLDG